MWSLIAWFFSKARLDFLTQAVFFFVGTERLNLDRLWFDVWYLYAYAYSVVFPFVDSRGLGLQPVKPAQVGQKFTVFNDENQEPVLPGQKGDWSDVPTRAVINKENEKKAGVWTKAKVGIVQYKKI